MDKTRIWIIGAVLATVVVVIGGWFLAIQPQLALAGSAAMTRAQIDATNAQNAAKLAALKKDYAELPQTKQTLAKLSESVPSGGAYPALVSGVDRTAVEAGVTVTSLTVSDAVAYQPVAAAATSSATSDGQDSGSTPTGTPTPTPTPTPSGPVSRPSAGLPPVTDPLITARNFAAIPVSVSVSGPVGNVLAFVKGVQSGPRLFLVTAFSIAPTDVPGKVDSKVAGYVYSLIPASDEPKSK
ncbi:hypothetical protein ACIRCZ_16320 [Leifsonia sp. NPDC102414]|uniref:hypothetical protein n=1 Tax=Leifsonia sp. NPDC102414 TaxID=3364124 RepID=UPI003810E681